MRIWVLIFILILSVAGSASAQTATPTETAIPTTTLTPISEPFVYATVLPAGETVGQMTRFDYTATAGDVQIVNLLTMLLVSVWGFFFFAAFVLVRYRVSP